MYIFKSFTDNVGGQVAARDYFISMLDAHPEIMEHPHVFAIALAFGLLAESQPIKGVDIFAARLREGGWKSNPMFDSFTYERGIYVPREKGVTCGTGLIILGEEEKLRRNTSGLEEYMMKWPDMVGLGPAYEPFL